MHAFTQKQGIERNRSTPVRNSPLFGLIIDYCQYILYNIEKYNLLFPLKGEMNVNEKSKT